MPLQGAKVKDVVRLRTVRHVRPAVKLATKLQMRRHNLCSQLRMTLSETFGHNIVDKTVTIGQSVAGLLTSKTYSRVRLVCRHGMHKEIDFIVAQRDVGTMKEFFSQRDTFSICRMMGAELGNRSRVFCVAGGAVVSWPNSVAYCMEDVASWDMDR